MHKNWCGKPCSECTDHCLLDELNPCSPDCTCLNADGIPGAYACRSCDAYGDGDRKLEALWEAFGDVPIDFNEEITEPFIGFEEGTLRYTIWSWFDVNYSKGVHALMFGE